MAGGVPIGPRERSRAALFARPMPWERPSAHTARLVLVAASYLAAARLGLELAYDNGSITAVWAPTGIALAAIVLWGGRMWPAVALGALLANSWSGLPVLAVLGIAAGNTLEALVGARLLRIAGFRPALDRPRDVLGLIGLAAGLSTLVSATVGVTCLLAGGGLSGSELAAAWRVWWLGDLAGDLLVAPLVLVLASAPRRRMRLARAAEAGCLAVLLALVCVLAFEREVIPPYVVFPVLAWMALRFHQAGAAVGSLLTAGLALWFTARGSGPFVVEGSPDTSLLLSQTFAAVAATTALLMAAVTSERERSRQVLSRAHAQLERRVSERTAQLEHSNSALALQSEIIANIAEGVVLVRTSDWTIAYANPEFEQMFGYGPGELDGRPVDVANAPTGRDPHEVAAEIQGALSEHGNWSGVVHNRRKDGTTFWCRVNVSNFQHPVHGEVSVAVHTDITERKVAQDAVQESAARLEHEQKFTAALLESLSEGVVACDAEGTLALFNRATRELHGLPKRPLPADRWAEHYDLYLADGETPMRKEDVPLFRAFEGERVENTEMVIAPRKGERRILLASGRPILGADGERLGAVVSMHDVTERKAIEARLREAEARFRHAFEDAGIGMALIGVSGQAESRFLQVNEAMCQLSGHFREELLELDDCEALTHPADLPAWRKGLQRLADGELRSFETELRIVSADGSATWVSVTTSLVRDGDNRPLYRIAHLQNIADRKRFEGELQHLADHDPRTGLFNRRRFEEELEREVSSTRRYGTGGAIVVLDLDNFKYVNDTLGHAAGDELVSRVADLLHGRLRASDLLARLGGDEFAVILPCADRAEAESVAQALLGTIREHATVTTAKGARRATASAGIAVFGDVSRLNAEELLIEADIAMYDAKEAGRDRLSVYDKANQRHASMEARIAWLEQIRRALDEERFVLHAQSIVALEPGAPAQFELLVRMLGPSSELIPPGAFLPVAERANLVQEIDLWVTCQAIRLLADPQRVRADVRLEVNLSAKSIGDSRLIETVSEELAATGVDPRRLVFEITETAAIVNVDHAKVFARELRELGCSFALDDFGAGFASFYYLKHLEFDYLKIDGEFIRNLSGSRTNQLIVQSMVDIARGLGKRTIAEFVGDQATLDLLRSYSVDFAQGFFLGRPRPVRELAIAAGDALRVRGEQPASAG